MIFCQTHRWLKDPLKAKSRCLTYAFQSLDTEYSLTKTLALLLSKNDKSFTSRFMLDLGTSNYTLRGNGNYEVSCQKDKDGINYELTIYYSGFNWLWGCAKNSFALFATSASTIASKTRSDPLTIPGRHNRWLKIGQKTLHRQVFK